MIQDPQGGTGGVPSPDGPRYVMPNFRQELLGKLLPEEATSRAPNGRWWRVQDFPLMRQKSMLRCPTYGNCDRCFSSGPMNGYCRECVMRGQYYALVRVDVEGELRMVDAEWISRFFGRSHLPAMADREIIGQRSNDFHQFGYCNMSLWMKLLGRSMYSNVNWQGTKEERDIALYDELDLFFQGVKSDGEGPWDRIDNPVTILDAIQDRNAPLPDFVL
jgi:hypothetical protein